MKFFELFYSGGPKFMFLVSILGLAMVFSIVRTYIKVYIRKEYKEQGINYILMFGSLAFIIGLLGQTMGMIGALDAIEYAGDVSPGLLAGGLKVSMIAPLYGLFYFILSIPLWMIVREKVKKGN